MSESTNSHSCFAFLIFAFYCITVSFLCCFQVHDKLVVEIITHIMDRFPDVGILHSFNQMFNPDSIPDMDLHEVIDDYGIEDVEVMNENVSSNKKVNTVPRVQYYSTSLVLT